MRFRKNRLRRRKEVQKVLSEGKAVYQSDGIFYIKYIRSQKGFPRFTVIVPKRTAKKSVWRNRIKRIFREAIRQLIKEEKIPSLDFVVFVRSNVYKMKSYQIKEMIEKLFTGEKFQDI